MAKMHSLRSCNNVGEMGENVERVDSASELGAACC